MSDKTAAIEVNNMGVKLLKQKDFVSAIEKFHEALNFDPACELAKENLAITYNNLGMTLNGEAAIHAFRRSLFLDPSAKYALDNLKISLSNAGKPYLTPQDHLTLANDELKGSNPVDAYVEYQLALQLKPDPDISKKAEQILAAAKLQFNPPQDTQHPVAVARAALAPFRMNPFSPEDIASTGAEVSKRVLEFAKAGIINPLKAEEESQSDLEVGAAAGIDQGDHGNCWFESSLAAIARLPRGQEIISKMITQSVPATFTVLFPGEPDNPVTVTADDLKQMKIHDHARWAAIIEAAELKLYPDNSREAVTGSGTTPAVTRGLSLFTGNAKYIDFDNCTNETIRQMLQRCGDGRHALVASSKQQSDPAMQLVIPNHGFTVIAFNQQNNTLLLRNPWGSDGHGYGRKLYPNLPHTGQEMDGIANLGGGLIKISFAMFTSLYRNLVISRCDVRE